MSTPTSPTIRPRPYRRFLTSALHTRFVHAALLSFVIAIDTSFWVGQKKDFFWSWFPLGPAGIRALLFFLSSLFVFVLQIATLTVGKPTSTAPVARMRSSILNFNTLQTIFWYLVSAWWFTEVYIWSIPSLGWITRGDASTPDKLNERPIYMRAFFLQLALVQACIHMYLGLSSLHIPVSPVQTMQATDQRTHSIETVQAQLQKKILPILARATCASALVTTVGSLVYGILLRQYMWRLHLTIAKPFFNLSRSNAHVSGIPPIARLLPSTFASGVLLSVTWELSSLLFLTYLKQDPVKKGLPLSAASKDPNGTLLNGLRAKRDVVKTFAFWELAIIAQKHPDRRKAIFADIERPTGFIWAQMLEEVLKVIQAVDKRIAGPLLPPPQSATEPISITTLPKLVPEPPKTSILAGKPKRGLISSEAQKLGTSPEPWRQPAESATHLLEYSASAGLEATHGPLEKTMSAITTSPVGWFFSTTNTAKINAVVLGSPCENAAVIVDAVESATKMLVASLAEDDYGKAVAGVPKTVMTFTKTITLIEGFIQQHRQGVRDLGEVGIVLARLKSGLKELLSAFQVYLVDVGLGIAELNEAKRAVEPKDILPPQKPRVQQEPQHQASVDDAPQETPSKPPAPNRRQQPRVDEGQPRRQGSQRQRLPAQTTSTRRKDWNGMNGQPERRREMEMVR